MTAHVWFIGVISAFGSQRPRRSSRYGRGHRSTFGAAGPRRSSSYRDRDGDRPAMVGSWLRTRQRSRLDPARQRHFIEQPRASNSSWSTRRSVRKQRRSSSYGRSRNSAFGAARPRRSSSCRDRDGDRPAVVGPGLRARTMLQRHTPVQILKAGCFFE